MELYRDHFQNYKRYNIPKAQLIIADIPYNVGNNAYGSNPQWYIDGDNAKGESEFAGKQFFDTDKDFRVAEFMHFVNTMLKKEPKERNQAGCMIVSVPFRGLSISNPVLCSYCTTRVKTQVCGIKLIFNNSTILFSFYLLQILRYTHRLKILLLFPFS